LERDKTGKSFILKKLQSTLVKERVSLSEVKVMYAAAHHIKDGLTDLNKELNSNLKRLRGKLTYNQSVKFEHNEKMFSVQLKQDAIQHKWEKDKREDKEASNKAALDANNVHTILVHSLQEKPKTMTCFAGRLSQRGGLQHTKTFLSWSLSRVLWLNILLLPTRRRIRIAIQFFSKEEEEGEEGLWRSDGSGNWDAPWLGVWSQLFQEEGGARSQQRNLDDKTKNIEDGESAKEDSNESTCY
jgi:hypothetical protein